MCYSSLFDWIQQILIRWFPHLELKLKKWKVWIIYLQMLAAMFTVIYLALDYVNLWFLFLYVWQCLKRKNQYKAVTLNIASSFDAFNKYNWLDLYYLRDVIMDTLAQIRFRSIAHFSNECCSIFRWEARPIHAPYKDRGSPQNIWCVVGVSRLRLMSKWCQTYIVRLIQSSEYWLCEIDWEGWLSKTKLGCKLWFSDPLPPSHLEIKQIFWLVWFKCIWICW